MADDRYNEDIGGSLGDARAAARRLREAADEALAAARAAQRAGAEPNRAAVQEEAARTRLRERAYEAPLSDAAKARQKAEIAAGRAAERKAQADDAGARASRQRVAAEQRLADLEKEYATAMRAKLSAAQRSLLSEVAAHPNDRPFYVRNTRTAESLERRGLVDIDRTATRPQMYATETGRGVADPSLILGDIEKQRQYIAKLVGSEAAAQADLTAATQRAAAAQQAAAAQNLRALPAAGQTADMRRSHFEMRTAWQRGAFAYQALLDAEGAHVIAEQQATRAAQEAARAALLHQRRIGAGGPPPRQIGPGAGTDIERYRTGPLAVRYARRPYDIEGTARSDAYVGPHGPSRPPPPPPRGGVMSAAGLPDPNNVNNYANAVHTATRAQDELRGSTQRMTADINASQNAWRRHGALTTEFIEAAARGEAGYREWGYQVGATAAKFAGWTAVSIPVFAALDGIRQIGKGAIDSSSGVNQLQRVINNIDAGQAQGTFRNLSRDFNVDIATASNAVYLAGQRFHDLPNATEAARAALLAFKAGGVDVEEGMTRLNSIVDAFGLRTGTDLVHVFDIVNEAQNTLGVSINDTLAGIATAGGAFRNVTRELSADQSVRELTALIGAFKTSAGLTGAAASTTIQRSAGYFRRPSNQETLRGYGIDPTQDFNKVIDDAIAVTRRLVAEGRSREIRGLAQGLSSPEFASRWEPLLTASAQGRGIVRTRAQLTEERTRDSGQRELEKILGAANERLRAFGNELQRFGAGIAQSGVLEVVLALVGGLTSVVGVVNTVIEAFNRLPDSVQQAMVAATIAGGGVALGRRLGVGEGRGGPVGAVFARSGEQQARVALRQALREQSAYLQAEAVGFANRARRAFQEADHAEQHVIDTAQRGPGVVVDRDTGRRRTQTVAEFDDEVAAARDEADQRKRTAQSFERRKQLLDVQSREYEQMNREARDARRIFRRSSTTAAQLVERWGLVVNTSQQRPNPGGVPGAPGNAGGATAPIAGAFPMTAAQAGWRQPATYNTAFRDLNRNWRQTEAWANAMRASAIGVGAAGTAAVSSLRRAGPAVAGAARGLYASIGPLGALLIGVELAAAAGNALRDRFEKQGQQYDRLGAQPGSPGQRAAQRREAQRIVSDRERRFREHNIAPERYQQVAAGAGDDKYLNARAALDALNAEEDINRKLRQRGQPQINRTRGGIEADIRASRTAFRQGNQTVEQRLDALRLLLAETSQSGALSGKQREALVAAINRDIGSTRDLRGGTSRTAKYLGIGKVAGLDPKSIEDDLKNLGDVTKVLGASRDDMNRIMDEGIALAAQYANDPSPQGRANYANAIQTIVELTTGAAKTNLERALSVANSAEARGKAYDNYFRDLSAPDRSLRERLKTVRADRRTLQNEQPGATRTEGMGNIDSARQARSLEQRLRAAKTEERNILKALSDRSKLSSDARRSMREEAFGDWQSRVQAQGAVDDYNLSAGLPRARAALERATNAVRKAVAAKIKRTETYLKLVADQRAAEDAVFEQQLATIDAQTNLNVANAGIDEEARSRAEVQGLQRKLAALQSNPRADRNDITNTLAQIREKKNDALRKAAEDETDYLRALYEYRISATDDPVEQARLQAELAQRILARGGFKNRAEKLRAQAEVNNSRRNERQARLQSKEDDIEFDLDMDRISVQDAIDRYNALLKGHNLTKAQRRQIQQRVHALQKQAEQDATGFDLDVGSIRMPTIYDVRRAFDPIRNSIKDARKAATDGMPTVLGQSAQPGGLSGVARAGVATAMAGPNLAPTINVYVNDPNAAGEVYTQIDRALRTTVKAKMKSRGHR